MSDFIIERKIAGDNQNEGIYGFNQHSNQKSIGWTRGGREEDQVHEIPIEFIP